ncbi:AraC family transcriptional regulator [Sodalis sp. RH22]|uniref:AraC family transcriptional regulator n=1 Tax=unclassified Sodalis (in: enterobacteria) TaxID=2636512 RepID=UPI0039B6219B
MNLKREYIEKKTNGSSFSYLVHGANYPYCLWHYHPEYELHMILDGEGDAIIGNSIRQYGNIYSALVGSNIPHNWIVSGNIDPRHQTDYVIQFSMDEFKVLFSNFPEFWEINKLLSDAGQGIEFLIEDTLVVKNHIVSMENDSPPIKLIKLFEILLHLAKSNNYQILNSAYDKSLELQIGHRIDKAIEYIKINFKKNPSLHDVSNSINMNSNAFCRKFKAETGLSYKNFLNKLKISYASDLLINTEHSITKISFESGFSNISNFNRRFMDINQISPSEFRRKRREA